MLLRRWGNQRQAVDRPTLVVHSLFRNRGAGDWRLRLDSQLSAADAKRPAVAGFSELLTALQVHRHRTDGPERDLVFNNNFSGSSRSEAALPPARVA